MFSSLTVFFRFLDESSVVLYCLVYFLCRSSGRGFWLLLAGRNLLMLNVCLQHLRFSFPELPVWLYNQPGRSRPGWSVSFILRWGHVRQVQPAQGPFYDLPAGQHLEGGLLGRTAY